MADEAGFKLEVLYSAIWPGTRSVLSGLRDVQFHHIEGRGGKRDRKLHSSLFNAIPLTDEEHDSGVVNQPELKAFFHRKAKEAVFYAVARGVYELTDIDREYLKKYGH